MTPAHDGSVGSAITYTAEPAPKPMPKVRRFNVTTDHTTIHGFEITGAGFMTADRGPGVSVTGADGVVISNNRIHHISDGAGIYRMPSSDVLIEQNVLSYAGDYLNPYGTRFVFRDNTIGPADPANPHHIDGIQPNGDTSNSLMEGNISVDNLGSDNHLFLNQNAPSTGWIIRYNLTHRSKGMLDWRNAAQIASIDYATNTVSLAAPLSWEQGDPVFLFKDSSGTQVLHGPAPDIGAYEFDGDGARASVLIPYMLRR